MTSSITMHGGESLHSAHDESPWHVGLAYLMAHPCLITFFVFCLFFFFFQAEDGIRDAQESRGLGMCIRDSVGIMASK